MNKSIWIIFVELLVVGADGFDSFDVWCQKAGVKEKSN